MAEGTIKAVKDTYGWIERVDGPDVFFHRNDLVDLVLEQRLVQLRVKFDEVAGGRGPRAKNVRPAD